MAEEIISQEPVDGGAVKVEDVFVPAENPTEDENVWALAQCVAFGGRALDDDHTATLAGLVAGMDTEDRTAFRAAVAQEALRLNPDMAPGQTEGEPYLVRLDKILKSLTALDAARKEADEAVSPLRDRMVEVSAEADALRAEDEAVGENNNAARISEMRREAASLRNQIENANTRAWRAMAATQSLMSKPSGFDLASETVSVGEDGKEFMFTLSQMRFNAGTRLGVIDVSQMSVLDVYHTIVAQDAGGTPASGTIVDPAQFGDEVSRREGVYENGILPLVSMWAAQHPSEMSRLKATVSASESGQSFTDERIYGRLIDSKATDMFSAARALSEVMRGGSSRYSHEELQKYFAKMPRIAPSPALTPEALDGYQVYSVGTSQNSERDFWSMVPEDTDIVVDIRPSRASGRYPHFNSVLFPARTKAFGMQYQNVAGLSGTMMIRPADYEANPAKYDNDPRLAAVRLVQGADGKKSIRRTYDFGGWMEDPGFAALMQEHVVKPALAGKKVCIVSTEGDPRRGPRALLLGQWLENNTDLHMAHVVRRRGGQEPTVYSQEDILKTTLGGRRRQLAGGNYLGLRYTSDGKFTVPDGDFVIDRSVAPKDTEMERLAAGREMPPLFGTDVTFNKIEADPNVHIPEFSTRGYRNIAANVNRSDFTILFSASNYDRQSRAVHELAPVHSKTVHLPSQKEDYYDETRIANAADAVTAAMTNDLARRFARRDGTFDPDAVKLCVEGSTEAYLKYLQTEEAKDAAEESPERRRQMLRLGQLGMTMDAYAGIDQKDIEHFVGGVLERVVTNVKKTVFDDESEQLFNVTDILSSYNTGAAEAAVTTGQRLGLRCTVNYVDPIVTIEDETPNGREVSDEALFQNRSRGWRHGEVTRRDLMEQIDAVAAERRSADDGLTPGLRESDMVALWEMGLSNGAIIAVMETAVQHGVVVGGAQDLCDLIEDSRGYAHDIPHDIGLEDVERAMAKAGDDIAAWRRDGIGIVTAASPLYPDGLDAFKDYHDEYAIQRRPAILWVKGDVTLLEDASVSLIHDDMMQVADERDAGLSYVTNADKRGVINRFTKVLADEKVPLVTKIDSTLEPAGTLGMISNDGRVVAVTTDGLPTGEDTRTAIDRLRQEESDVTNLLMDLRSVPRDVLDSVAKEAIETGAVTPASMEGLPEKERPALLAVMQRNVDTVKKAAEQYPEDDLRESLSRMRDAAAVDRRILEASTLRHGSDAAADVVRKGGLLVSETPPGQKATAQSRSRADRIVAGVGKACAFVTEVHNARPMGIFEMAFYAMGGVAVLAVKGVDFVAKSFAAQKDISAGHIDGALKDVEEIEAMEATEDAFEKVAHDAVETADAMTESPEEGLGQEKASRRRLIDALAPMKESRAYNRLRNARDKVDQLTETMFGGDDVRLSQAKVDVLHMGSKRVFVVPENQPQIERALKDRYGDKIVITDAFSARKMKEDYEAGAVTVDGVNVRRWQETSGTAMLHREAYYGRIYYLDGKVLSLSQVPNGRMGLPTPAERTSAREAWKRFTNQVSEMQKTFQKETGIHVDGQASYMNADYVHVAPLAVEVRRDNEVRCRIWFEDGEIRAKNFQHAADDFQEYHETPTYPVLEGMPLENGSKRVDPNLLSNIVTDIHNALYTRPTTEQNAIAEAEADPGLAAEREEKIRNGFLIPRMDNFSIAQDDVGWGLSEGTLPDMPEMVKADDLWAFYAAEKALDADKERFETLGKQMKKLEAQMKDLVRQAELNPESEDLAEQRHELEEKMEEAATTRRNLALKMADLKDVREAALAGGALMEIRREGKGRDLVIDGRVVTMPGYKPKKESLEAAAERMRELLGGKDPEEAEKKEPEKAEAPEEKKTEEPPKEAPAEEAREQDPAERLEELGRWLSEAEKDPAKRNSEEYREKADEVQRLLSERRDAGQATEAKDEVPQVQTLENGSRILAVEGGFAMLDGRGDPTGGVYPRFVGNNPNYTRAFRDAEAPEDKKAPDLFHAYDTDGNRIADDWMRAVYRADEGLLAFYTEDGYFRVWDENEGRLLNNAKYRGMDMFHDGYALVRGNDNRFNFLGRDGNVLSPSLWFDRAESFKDGKAAVSARREAFLIDTAGNLKPVLPPEKKLGRGRGSNDDDYGKGGHSTGGGFKKSKDN